MPPKSPLNANALSVSDSSARERRDRGGREGHQPLPPRLRVQPFDPFSVGDLPVVLLFFTAARRIASCR